MRKYEDPKLELMKFSTEDIITTSTEEEEDPGFMTNPCI